MTAEIRRSSQTVGIIAVDPTSPFTGGAILGDRVRMTAHAADAGVYIRSMATRGHLGGLSRATSDVALVLDAAGKDVIVIETVGVGQDEVDIVRTADVSIVVVVPGAGDDVQAIKAGIMEIGDIFVVNKADREGADRAAQAIAANLSLGEATASAEDWKPPIVKTEATRAIGIDELWRQIRRYREHSADRQAARRRERQRVRLRELLARQLVQRIESSLPSGEIERMAERVAARELDPYSAVAEMIQRVRRSRLYVEMRAILDHVGIAVKNLDEALAFYRDGLGLHVEVPEEVASQRVRAHFIPAGQAALELLEPTSGDSAIARYVEKRGPGLHHITLRVDDIHAALEQLRARGVRLVDEQPRPGAEGALVAFIHPSAAHGVLVELKQAPPPAVRLDVRTIPSATFSSPRCTTVRSASTAERCLASCRVRCGRRRRRRTTEIGFSWRCGRC